MWTILIAGMYLIMASGVVISLTLSPILLYRFVLKKIHPLYSLLLLIYPGIIYFLGNMLVKRGEKLNLEDLTSRMTQGEDTHIFSIDAGISSFFWGYSFLIGSVPIVLVVIIIIILRFILTTSIYTE